LDLSHLSHSKILTLSLLLVCFDVSMTSTGESNKVVLRGFSREPMVVMEGGVLTVSAGEPCDGSAPTADDSAGVPTTGTSSASAAFAFLNFGLPIFLGRGVSSGVGSALLTTLALSASAPFAGAQETAACESVPIEVDIYVGGAANELVMREAQSGDFEVCPPESKSNVFANKFRGSQLHFSQQHFFRNHVQVSTGSTTRRSMADMKAAWEKKVTTLAVRTPKEFGKKMAHLQPCTLSNGTVRNVLARDLPLRLERTGFFGEIRWTSLSSTRAPGKFANHPEETLRETHQLNFAFSFDLNRLNPVVSFPFNRGPYPLYAQGVALDEANDDSSDARAMAKDLLVYIGAFVETELEEYEITMTEGAESGMVAIWGGKALEIAQTTCNRDIYALMEVPAYGYNPGDSASIANKFASSFYNSSECLCFADDSCKQPTVTVSNRGWLPLTPLPAEMGGDGIMYSANSASAASPWFESMVFPENPSGKIKTPQLADPNRRVCDGVYVWPMYFGMRVSPILV
jgi:hypothetical protein